MGHPRPVFASLVGGGLLALVAGCSGQISGGSPGATTGPGPIASGGTCAGAKPAAGATRLRRLTREEYRNSVSDLLATNVATIGDLPVDERLGAFSANVEGSLDAHATQGYFDVAAQVAAAAMTRLVRLLPCDPAKVGDDACADQFMADFARRAFRRSVSADELATLRAVYQTGKARAGLQSGIELFLNAVLVSPHFLYIVEEGRPTGQASLEALSPYSLASRLSFFLWGGPPDDSLHAAAGAGALDKPEGVAAQAKRMLADSRARRAVAEFHRAWLGIENLPTIQKNATLYPTYAGLRDAMMRETDSFVDYVIRSGDGKVETLLSAPESFLDAALAKFYGVAIPAGQDPGKPVPLDGKQRAGVLTHASVLSAHADNGPGSPLTPIRRGLLVAEMLCLKVPPPPGNVGPAPNEPTKTLRERMAQHRTPACAVCHEHLEPIGFGFDHYDVAGAYHALDKGQPIDSSGQLEGAAFNGAIELGSRLAATGELRDCLARQWFRFALARLEQAGDACTLDTLAETLRGSGPNLREAILALAASDAFRYRAVTP